MSQLTAADLEVGYAEFGGEGMQRILVFALMGASIAFAGEASAGDAYDNQIKMTMTLMAGSPASFREMCRGLGGTHTEAEDKAKCVRGMTTMMIAFVGDTVRFGMVAYPATPKDIRSLWTKAVQIFGEPDERGDEELTWWLEKNIFASAVYDDEHSMFALGLIPE